MKQFLSFFLWGSVITSALVCVLTSCQPSEEKCAETLLLTAQQQFVGGNLNAARLTIDSLHSTYPKQVAIRRRADTLVWRIDLKEITRTQPYLDSMIAESSKKNEQLLKNFKFYKDERYQDVGSYEHQLMQAANNTGRSYLKPITDEQGNFSFMAQYVGGKINFTSLTVTIDGLSSDTGEADEDCRNSYDNQGVHRETALFTEEIVGDVARFIANNVGHKITVTFNGSSARSVVMTARDVEIFAQTYDLSVALSDAYHLQRQLQNNMKRLEILNQRLNP